MRATRSSAAWRIGCWSDAGGPACRRSSQPPLPSFEVQSDRTRYRPLGAGQHRHSPASPHAISGEPGPHVALLAIAHGNEIAGAIVLDRLLQAGLAPTRGRLTFGFVNLGRIRSVRSAPADRFAFRRRGHQPGLGRERCLIAPRRSIELDRAREIRPLIDTVDVLFDLHSMLWPSDPLILCGTSPKGRGWRCGAGVPGLVVADHGHASGRRLIDYVPLRRSGHAVRRQPGGSRPALGAGNGGHHARQRCRPAAPPGHGRPASGAAGSRNARSSASPRSPWR